MYDSLSALVAQAKQQETPLWQLIVSEDARDQGCGEEEVFAQITQMYEAMRGSDRNYDPSLRSASGMAGGQAQLLHAYREKKRQEGQADILCGSFLGDVMERALKIAESNACMRRIVAAPTAGSCGVVPAVLLTLQEKLSLPDEQMVRALIIAGGIGGVIASRASLAGAEGGCQAEIGSASSMAAGAAAFLLGGDADRIETAAALALKNLLGLACDPVGGLVEVPCIKRNVIGAVNAMTSAELAMAGICSRIPADEVYDAMRAIGRRMDESIRETGIGGLAGTPTGKKIGRRETEPGTAPKE